MSEVPTPNSNVLELPKKREAEFLGNPNIIEPSPSVIVERRRVGNVEIVGVLAEHTAEHMQPIIDAMTHCDVLAFEQVGTQNETERQNYGRGYTHLLSTTLNPEKVNAVFTRISTKVADQESAWLIEGLSQLRGTDKRVVVLDISRDHPDFPRVQKSKELKHQFAESIVNLSPVIEAKRALEASIAATAESYQIRDSVIKDQIQALTKDGSGPKIGVTVGTMHYRALMEIGEPSDAMASWANHTKIARAISLYDQAVESIRKDGSVPPALVNRALAFMYLRLGTQSMHEADAIAHKLNDDQIETVLETIQEYVIELGNEPKEKEKQVNAYLEAVVNLAKDLKT